MGKKNTSRHHATADVESFFVNNTQGMVTTSRIIPARNGTSMEMVCQSSKAGPPGQKSRPRSRQANRSSRAVGPPLFISYSTVPTRGRGRINQVTWVDSFRFLFE